jgi:hypothetical protein
MAEDDGFQTLMIPQSAKLTQASFDRVRAKADAPCRSCDTHLWRLSKWQRGNGWSVDIQCVECGLSGQQPFPKSEHPNWETYPEFNKTQHESWKAAKLEDYYREKQERRAQRSAEYGEWLETSPEWRDMRRRVISRAKALCEACLERRATTVHHQTYELGRLPPAYYLVALCETCHDRMHAPGDEWNPQADLGKTFGEELISTDEVDGEIDF